jgi:hypothetical protein
MHVIGASDACTSSIDLLGHRDGVEIAISPALIVAHVNGGQTASLRRLKGDEMPHEAHVRPADLRTHRERQRVRGRDGDDRGDPRP